MWTVVYIAANFTQAQALKNLLYSEGVLADVRPVGIANLGDGMYEILVLESEAEEAHRILCENAVK